jgi:competence protein ComEC
VGQGDGILIKTPKGHDIVVDGGPGDYAMTDCLARHLPFWDREIDVVFLTHPDSDHLTGIIEVIKSYSVKQFGTSQAPKDTDVYKELISVLAKRGIGVLYVTKGDRVETTDGLVMDVVWPTDAFISGGSSDTNEYSLVHYVKFGESTALLTGDVTSVYLNSIMLTIGHTDIFKSPHHGSKTGVDEFTFQHNKPQIAVISAGENNSYGHPHKEVLNLFKSNDIPYYETKNGDLEFISDGVKWWVTE